MIPAANPVLYQAALAALSEHRQAVGSDFKGRFIQIFLGMKFYQNFIPSMFSNSFVTTETFQTLLDDLYAKASRPANDAVLVLFNSSYLARTGIRGVGNRSPQNTWRNNFNLQKGVGCYAPPSDLASPSFLNQSRVQCRYLAPARPGSLSDARCSLQPRGAAYRNEDHRKWLRIDPNDEGYAVVDLQNYENFVPYVAPSSMRIPVLPLIASLYHDGEPGLVIGQRSRLDIADFLNDFNFSLQEYDAYFDEDPSSRGNAALLRRFKSISYSRAGTGVTSAPSARVSPRRFASRPPLPSLPPPGTSVPPPAANSGFEAEQFVADALTANGWVVHNVSRQQLGYDLVAKRGRTTRYIETKSSLGLCSPSLTSREWQQASAHSAAYILAIIENFNAIGSNTIFWVPDPAGSCVARQSQAINYAIARSSWAAAAVSISAL